MHRTIRIASLIIALVVLAALSSKGALVPDPTIPDTLRIDTTVAFVSGSGVIPVYFYNDEALYGLEATLTQHAADVKIDSFSFVGSRVAAVQFRNTRINSDSTIITISVLGGVTNIPAGTGLLGKLYLSYPSSITPQMVPIDTITWTSDQQIEYSTKWTLPEITEFIPKVVPGALMIDPNPPTYDSLWVANTEAFPGHPLAVDVYLYNERNVKDAYIALKWGSTYLTFDSASYVGTRSASAQTKSVQYSNNLKELLANLQFGELTPLTPGSGVAIRFFFSVATAPDTSILIDTVVFASVQSTYLVLTAVDGNAQFVPIYHPGTVHVNAGTGVDDGTGSSLPRVFSLGQNYPNPFNPITTIEFALPKADHVTIEMYDILGRSVRTLVDEQMPAGVHRVQFDGRSKSGNQLATGIYFYRMTTSSFTATRKMLMLK